MTKVKAQPIKKPRNNSQAKLPVKEHLEELGRRFYVWLFFFLSGSVLGFIFYSRILEWLIAPLNKPLYYTSPVGGFEVVFSVSTMFGFVVSLPVFMYQIIKFIEPINIYRVNNKIKILIIGSLILAALGIATSYYIIFPASLRFLGTFGGEQLESLISTRDYFNFVGRYLLGFAILFQLPLIIYIASLFVTISVKSLIKQLKFVVAGSFIISAILTPTPDFVNQTIMAIPLIALYMASILILQVKAVIVK